MRNLPLTIVAFSAIVFFGGACSSDDNVVQTSPSTQEAVISFDSYIGRSNTRASILDNSTIGSKGFGVFAYLTTNGKYGSSEANNNFIGNFMTNIKVTGTAIGENENSWSYSPLRYWPQGKDEYVSFLAYAPYKDGMELKASDGSTSGDLTYISYDATQGSQYDLTYSSSDATNQYLRVNSDGSGYDKSGNFTEQTLRQMLNFKHATARIAFAVTSEILKAEANFKEKASAVARQGMAELTSDKSFTTSSDATITVEKIMLLGDNSSADKDNVTGAFTPLAYLNLNYIPEGGSNAGRWVIPASNESTKKLSFTYNGSDLYTGKYDSEAAVTGKWTPDESSKKQNTIKGVQTCTVSVTPNTKTDGGAETTYTHNIGASSNSVNTIGNGKDGYLFIVPQDFTTDNLYCYIEYTVSYGSNTGLAPIKYSGYGKITQNFEAGHSYLIYLNIGGRTGSSPIADPDPSNPSSFNAIQFSVEQVADWGNETETSIKS